MIELRDFGVAIPTDTQARFVEPFGGVAREGDVRVPEISEALGIIRAHGGLARIQSQSGAGTTIDFLLPAAVDPDVNLPPSRRARQGESRGGTIIVVEPAANDRRAFQEALARAGYQVAAVEDAVEALRLIAARPGQVPLVFTSLTTPSMTGTALARAASLLEPGIRVIAWANHVGSIDHPITEFGRVRGSGLRQLLIKPVTVARLLDLAEAELKSPT